MTAPIENIGGLGLTDEQRAQLAQPLDMSRVKQKPGKKLDYLQTHDVIRTANRIFGFGRWGHEVIDLTCVGQSEKTSTEGRKGVYVGYRCIVRLTVAGCVPVCGVGYGDGVEYQEQSAVTAHELAVKEAESDALKRALRNFGDQFGLVLYAKPGAERNAVMTEVNGGASGTPAPEQSQTPAKRSLADGDREAEPAEIGDVIATALTVSAEFKDDVVRLISQHRGKNEGEPAGFVSAKWLATLSDRVTAKAAEAHNAAAAVAEAFGSS